MNKQWIRNKNFELENKRNSFPDRLLVIWEDFPEGYHYIFPSIVVYIMRILKMSAKYGEPIDAMDIYRFHEILKSNISAIHCKFDTDKEFFENKCKMTKDQLDRFILRLLAASAEYVIYLADPTGNYDHLLDSPAVPMEGDIIITDPYHFLNTKITQNNGTFVLQNSQITLLGCHYERFMTCGFGKYDEKEQTIKEEYTVQPTRLCVGALNDILTVAPDYDDYETKPYQCIRIKDFKGKVQVQVREVKLHGLNKCDVQYQAFIVGKGVNMITNEPVNFEMQAPNASKSQQKG